MKNWEGDVRPRGKEELGVVQRRRGKERLEGRLRATQKMRKRPKEGDDKEVEETARGQGNPEEEEHHAREITQGARRDPKK